MDLTFSGRSTILALTATQFAAEVESSENQGESRLSRFFYVYLVMVGVIGGLISRWFLDPVFQPVASTAQRLKAFGGGLITIKETYHV